MGRFLVALWLVCMGLSAGANPVSTMKATELRCEGRRKPLGVDEVRPRLSWKLTAASNERNRRQSAYRILVASSKALLANNKGDLWDSGRVASSQQDNIGYAGSTLGPSQVCFWKVQVWDEKGAASWGEVATWETGLLLAENWKAQWINDGKPAPTKDADFYREDPAPHFRKEFQIGKSVAKARLYITGLGYYEAKLNGARVGDHVLDPGWTKFDKRTFYSVYDVTRQLAKGQNCLGVTLGNGWYNPLPLKLFGAFNLRDKLAIGRPRLIAQLRIEYRDGSVEIVGSDRSWKVGESAIRRNNIYLGEVVDARKAQPGWDRPGFNDAQWRTPALATEKVGQLIAQPLPPIKVTAKWHPVKVTEPIPDTYIYDCGVNFAGWLSLKVNLPAGTKFRLRYGELLHGDGTLNPMTSVAGQIKSANVGGPGAPAVAWQEDTFISAGSEETYTPRFTFHAFRYVEITGLPGPVPLTSLTALRLNSSVEKVGNFSCSNPLLNDIQKMCERTFLSNIFSVQSDCPHRERLGYGGDIVATSDAFMRNFDMSGFYAKTVTDWSDSALSDGMLTDTAPFMGIQYCGVIWAMAHPHLIDGLYRYYGDEAIALREYEAAKRWLLLVEKQYPDGIVTEGLSDHEGLASAPSPVMVTPMFFHSAKLLATLAGRLGKASDQAHFLRLADKVQAAYVARYVDLKSGSVGPGTQASQSFALHAGIVPEEARLKVLQFLVRDLIEREFKLTTGILGTKFMLDVLSREGMSDLAYAVVNRTDFPGWGWMLKIGATTLWEHWEFSDNTFSHNHPMFGSVSEWMMNWLGGIQVVGPDKFVVRPQTVPGLQWVKSSYKSSRGRIVSNWTKDEDRTEFEIAIPPNMVADVFLPVSPGATISEGGKPLKLGSGAFSNEYAKIVLGSGAYKFSVLSKS